MQMRPGTRFPLAWPPGIDPRSALWEAVLTQVPVQPTLVDSVWLTTPLKAMEACTF